MRRVHQERRNIYPIIGVGIGLFAVFVAWIVRIVTAGTSPAAYIIFVIGVFVAAGTGVFFRAEWKRILSRRQTSYGSVVALSVLFVLGIAVVANIIAASRLDIQYDFTQEKFFTLSEQSLKIVRSLEQPVHVIGFFTSDPEDFRYQDRLRAEQLLTLYKRESRGKLTFELVDPYLKPQIAQEYDVQYESKTIFEAGDRRESTTTVSEMEFTATLLRLTRKETPKIYFTTGHDERRIDEYGNPGLQVVADALARQNYAVAELALREQSPVRVPSDAAAVVIAGPRLPFDASEIAALDAYLRRGGRLLLLIDPPTDAFRGLKRWLRRWGIEVGNDVVIDLLAHVQEPTIPVGQFESHQITESFLRQRRSIPFRYTTSIRKVDPPPDHLRIDLLVQTNPSETAAWAETNFDDPQPRLDANDRPGPVPFGYAVAEEVPEGEEREGARLVVIGDSDFASNAFRGFGGEDFFLNSVNWLTIQENLIAITPKDASDRRLRPISSRTEALMLLGVTMFFMPLLFAGIGIVVWWRRR